MECARNGTPSSQPRAASAWSLRRPYLPSYAQLGGQQQLQPCSSLQFLPLWAWDLNPIPRWSAPSCSATAMKRRRCESTGGACSWASRPPWCEWQKVQRFLCHKLCSKWFANSWRNLAGQLSLEQATSLAFWRSIVFPWWALAKSRFETASPACFLAHATLAERILQLSGVDGTFFKVHADSQADFAMVDTFLVWLPDHTTLAAGRPLLEGLAHLGLVCKR